MADGTDAGRDAPRFDVPSADAPADVPSTDVPGIDAPLDAGADTPDAPALPDTPPDAGFVACPSGALVCDDFEGGAPSRLPPWRWGVGADPQSTARAFMGTSSARFASPGGMDSPYHHLAVEPSSRPSDIWVRFWLYVPSSTMVGDGAFAAVVATSAPFGNVSLVYNAGGVGVFSTVADRYVGTRPFARDVWQCVAYHVALGDPGLVEVFVEGEPSLSMRLNTNLSGVGFVGAGLTYIGPGQTMPVEIYIDDAAVTVDGQPLLCP